MSIDWPALLRLGLQLGIAPAALWQLAVREWRALLGSGAAGQALTRAALGELAARFPDQPDTPLHRETRHG
jgi:uncharacterized phage protein (TIGR02216 family)